MQQRRRQGVVVTPRSEAEIAGETLRLRRVLGVEDEPFFPVVQVYDLLDLLADGARYEVVDDRALGEDHARTYPDRGLILVSNTVYERAARKMGRDRFTLCHELGHLGLHRHMAFSRINPAAPPANFRNSEWQADVYASHLMMPDHLVRHYQRSEDVARDFGVSIQAADVRLRKQKATKLAS